MMLLLRIGRHVLTWVSVSLVVVGFFLPWAHLQVYEPKVLMRFANQLTEPLPLHQTLNQLTSKVGRIALRVTRGVETVVTDLPSPSDIPSQVSGADIPTLLNQQKAKGVMALVALVTNKPVRLGAQSYLVYLVPAVALVCALVLTYAGRYPLIVGLIMLVCAAVSGVGTWKVLTAPLSTSFMTVTIGNGLWYSLVGYGLLAFSALLALALKEPSA